MLKQLFFALGLCCVLTCVNPEVGLAHRVNIFASVQGDDVFVECGFSKSSPAIQAQISVFAGQTEKLLLTGKTDQKGHFSFPLTEEMRKHGLKICVDAGEGHRNEWLIEADENGLVQKEQRDTEPHLIEIVGGMGWIVGLTGIAMYFRRPTGGNSTTAKS